MESLKGFYRINEEDYYPIDEEEAISVKEVRQDIEEFVGDNLEEINIWDISRCECAWYITIIALNRLPEEFENGEEDDDMVYIKSIIKMLLKRIKDLGGKIDIENFTIIDPERDEDITI
jgi:hypothetical protein